VLRLLGSPDTMAEMPSAALIPEHGRDEAIWAAGA